ncbi:hypothetical protein ACCC96_01845 [Pseudomonas sp. Pseusp11]|uniref:SDH family Clp fold serine proteinase n=1 Tax=Pseudomonas sp. Pseusp11 TaxID=3243003 RepID=UPI0039B58743
MFEQRKALYADLENRRSSKVITYITGDRPGLETQIHEEVFDYFASHLDAIGVTEKISLILYTRGGNTLAAWSLVNLIRQFCNELELIVPSKCHSSGTIMSLGADRIIMTKQATLGPIDPSLNTPLNPAIDGAPPQVRYPVSVEAVKGYMEFIASSGVKNESEVAKLLLDLSQKVHPLVLGQMHRSRSQIQMLAKRLLQYQVKDETAVERIISFLCSDSGSHDYTINRREAADLGLIIEKPNDDLYLLINSIYKDFKDEMQLGQAFDPEQALGQNAIADYEFRRAIVESSAHGCYYFSTCGNLNRVQQQAQLLQGFPPGVQLPPGFQMPVGGNVINDNRTFEGWRFTQ